MQKILQNGTRMEQQAVETGKHHDERKIGICRDKQPVKSKPTYDKKIEYNLQPILGMQQRSIQFLILLPSVPELQPISPTQLEEPRIADIKHIELIITIVLDAQKLRNDKAQDYRDEGADQVS